MGLLKCPDCGNEVSDQAASCPKCGRPRDKTAAEKIEGAGKNLQAVGCLLTLLITVPIVIIVLLGGCPQK